MMDLREARACLDEHRILLAAISDMLKPNVAKDEAGQAIGKFNDGLIETLNSQLKDAVILSILISEGITETPEQVVEFPGEGADLVVALNQLRLVIDKATEVSEEYRRQAEAASIKAKAINPVAAAIREYKRRNGRMSKEEIEEYDRDMGYKSPPDLVKTLNTPDPIEICAATETVAPGNEAEAEIRIESLESASPSADNPGEGCGTRANCTDDTEDLLNWVSGIDRTSVIAVLSSQAEAVQQSVQRFASRPAKLREAMDRVDRVNRILSFFRDGNIAPDMSEHELSLCRSFEERMPVRGPS